jgi:hypothetical protein
MHFVLRNLLPPGVASRSLHVRVVDARGRATRAGAEVRVYAAGTRNLVAMRLIDTGSGYNAQNDIAVHVGLASSDPVDVEVTWPDGSRRVTEVTRNVSGGRAITVRIGR